MSEVLRQYIRATLQELRVDPHMMSLLRGTHLRPSDVATDKEARAIALEWLDDLKDEQGEVSHYTKMRVLRYVARKWPTLVRRFRGDKHAARQTMYNLLDTRLSDGEG